MIIAIDMDGTWAADKKLFTAFSAMAIKAGHTVYCVTARPETDREEITKILNGAVNGLYMTGYEAKRPYMQEREINVNIWIDDHPETIPSIDAFRDLAEGK